MFNNSNLKSFSTLNTKPTVNTSKKSKLKVRYFQNMMINVLIPKEKGCGIWMNLLKIAINSSTANNKFCNCLPLHLDTKLNSLVLLDLLVSQSASASWLSAGLSIFLASLTPCGLYLSFVFTLWALYNVLSVCWQELWWHNTLPRLSDFPLKLNVCLCVPITQAF